MMASGEVWNYSYDGIILLLCDVLAFISKQNLHSFDSVKQTIPEVKLNLQNMLYSLVMLADQYPSAHLNGLIFCVQNAYEACTHDKSKLRTKSLRFELEKMRSIHEFYLDSRHLEDKNVKEAFLRSQEENPMSRYLESLSDLEQEMRVIRLEQERDRTRERKDEIREKEDFVEALAELERQKRDIKKEYLGACFTNYLLETNQQIYDLYNFFDNNIYFDVCLKIRSRFAVYGFKFSDSVDFIRDIVVVPDPAERSQHTKSLGKEKAPKEVDLNKISNKITKIIQRDNPNGRKTALREEKKQKLDVNFE